MTPIHKRSTVWLNGTPVINNNIWIWMKRMIYKILGKFSSQVETTCPRSPKPIFCISKNRFTLMWDFKSNQVFLEDVVSLVVQHEEVNNFFWKPQSPLIKYQVFVHHYITSMKLISVMFLLITSSLLFYAFIAIIIFNLSDFW